jgi:hypothetical protein
MEALARVLVSGAELVEAEGRMLKRQVLRLAIALGLGLAALVLGLAGVGFLLAALFLALAQPLGYAGAAAVFGAVALVLAAAAGFFVWRVYADSAQPKESDAYEPQSPGLRAGTEEGATDRSGEECGLPSAA